MADESFTQVINVWAGERSNGTPVFEEVRVENLGNGKYRLLQSPGLVLGAAADDVFKVSSTGRIVVVSRGKNLCVHLYFTGNSDALEREASARLSALGGRIDGKSARQLVYTVPITAGFAAVEGSLNELVTEFAGAEWYYGNVYSPEDGVTPLNWW